MNQIAAVVEIAMRARAAGLEMTDFFWLGWRAHVEDEKTFGEWLTVGAAPARRDSFEARDHLCLGHLDLNCPGILRPGNKNTKLRRRWIGDVDHAPAPVPEMGDVEI